MRLLNCSAFQRLYLRPSPGLQVGHSLPSTLIEHLKNGAPFKAAFDAPEDQVTAGWGYHGDLR